MTASVVAHCDWSIDPRKRWMAVAVRRYGLWHLSDVEPVGDSSTLFERLSGRVKEPGAVLVGFDFPIGLPQAYGERTALGNFRRALATFGSGDWAEWFSVCERAADIRLHRPFYPQRPGGTSRAHLFEALKLNPEALLRQCERKTATRNAACSLFWTLGGNQVGKAAINGWREVIQPHLNRVGLWPFEGDLKALCERFPIVLAETYPGDGYGQLSILRRAGWSKRRQTDRADAGRQWLTQLAGRPLKMSHTLTSRILDGFGPEKAGEDPFDAMIGLIAMLEVVDGRRTEGPADLAGMRTWEGWILGQAD